MRVACKLLCQLVIETAIHRASRIAVIPYSSPASQPAVIPSCHTADRTACPQDDWLTCRMAGWSAGLPTFPVKVVLSSA